MSAANKSFLRNLPRLGEVCLEGVDFPRLPLTRNLALFRALAAKGKDLVALHLMESPALSRPITKLTGKGDSVIAKGYPTYEDKTVWINDTQGFAGMPQDVWEFHIGGYQVCHKWLKDRRERTLSADDISHYHKIVVALKETIRLMGEIDEAIPGCRRGTGAACAARP